MCNHQIDFKNKFCSDCGYKFEDSLSDLQKENFANYLSKKFNDFCQNKNKHNASLMVDLFFNKNEDAMAVKWRLKGRELYLTKRLSNYQFHFYAETLSTNNMEYITEENVKKHIDKMTHVSLFVIGEFKVYYIPVLSYFKEELIFRCKFSDDIKIVDEDITRLISFQEKFKCLKAKGYTKEQLVKILED